MISSDGDYDGGQAAPQPSEEADLPGWSHLDDTINELINSYDDAVICTASFEGTSEDAKAIARALEHPMKTVIRPPMITTSGRGAKLGLSKTILNVTISQFIPSNNVLETGMGIRYLKQCH